MAGRTHRSFRAEKLRGILRKKEILVRESLRGYCSDFDRMMLGIHYRHYEFISRQIQELEAEITKRMEPYSPQITVLMNIPGVERMVAWHLFAEVGADISVFPHADHCASWAGVSRWSCESAGKQLMGAPKRSTNGSGRSRLDKLHPERWAKHLVPHIQQLGPRWTGG